MLVKVGTRFQSIKSGKKFHIVGAAKGSASGLACLASIEFGWSYTGEMHQIKDLHSITEEEMKTLMGNHPEWFALDLF
jgi:hypothetical protein